MNKVEFIKYIESIGFKQVGFSLYKYKEFNIYLYGYLYELYNNSEGIEGIPLWITDIPFNDLTPVLKIIRSIKLKKILEWNRKSL